MRLKTLTIHNIASIENAVIDFEAQPLCDSEVFLITGDTGSGKSTILDAICLALYADTPRLNTTSMQGNIKDAGYEVKIDDPRQLLRRNTGEGGVMLTFEGSNGVDYEASWSVARARKKSTGNIQKKSWELKNLGTGIVLTKDKDIQAEIKTAIGLDFKQFCRTTLLAQGEFTRFLNSKDDEKADILEKITGVDIYTKIGAKIFVVANDKKREWTEARQQMEGISTLSEEEIAEKKSAVNAFEEQYQQLKKQGDADRQKVQWLTTAAALEKRKATAEEEYAKIMAVTEGEAMKAKAQLVERWNATVDARGWLTAKNAALQEVRKQEEVLRRLCEHFCAILDALSFEEQKKNDTDAACKRLAQVLEAEKSYITEYAHVQTIVGHLAAMESGRKKIADEKNSIRARDKQLVESLMPAYEKVSGEASAAKRQYEEQETEVKRQEEEVAQLGIPSLRLQRDSTKELLMNLGQAIELVDSLSVLRQQAEKMRESLASRLRNIEQKEQECAALIPKIHDAEIKKNVCKEQLERQRDTIDKFAKAMREKLRPGDECPVCGQRIVTPLPHEDTLAVLVEQLNSSYLIAEKEYDRLLIERSRIEAFVKTERQSYNRDKEAFEKDETMEKTRQRLLAVSKVCGIDTGAESDVGVFQTLKADAESVLMNLTNRIHKSEQQEEALKGMMKTLDAQRRKANALQEDVQKEWRKVEECKHKNHVSGELIKVKQDDVQKAEEALSSLIIGEWDEDWKTSPHAFAEVLKTRAEQYAQNVQRKQTLDEELKERSVICAQVSATVQAIVSAMSEWGAMTATAPQEMPNLITKINEVNVQVANALSLKRQAAAGIEESCRQLNDFYTVHDDYSEAELVSLNSHTRQGISHLSVELKEERDKAVSQKALVSNASEQLKAHLGIKPEYESAETLEYLQARLTEIDSKLAEISVRKGALGQELTTDAENKERLSAIMSEVSSKKEVFERWDHLRELLGDATGSKFRKIAQSYVLASLIYSANVYMETLTSRYTLKVVPGSFVILLEDAYQGYVSRPASTLSGGESFLVSLALALALSDIGNRLSVDTLFIDEGFGTLSGEPLQNAVNTLRSLHSKSGRHVGIISHVEELRERIPIQIQVRQESNHSSSSVMVVLSDS